MSETINAKALTKTANKLREAIKHSRMAYLFCPSSYTHSAFQACLTAVHSTSTLRRWPLPPRLNGFENFPKSLSKTMSNKLRPGPAAVSMTGRSIFRSFGMF
jgi:hypothetical protein